MLASFFDVGKCHILISNYILLSLRFILGDGLLLVLSHVLNSRSLLYGNSLGILIRKILVQFFYLSLYDSFIFRLVCLDLVLVANLNSVFP